jgi:hypothetical protein
LKCASENPQKKKRWIVITREKKNMRSKEEEVKYLREKRAYIFTIGRVHLFTYSGLDSDQQKKTDEEEWNE